MKGAWGEAAARGYLTRAGYRIVDCNFRTRFGEIDIIAQAGEYLTPAKQARILAAAEEWLQGHPTMLQPRFDVIEVYGEEGAPFPPRINHLENAFGG